MKLAISQAVTNGTIFNAASGTANTSAALNISRFDEVTFYATASPTAAVAYTATVSCEASPDGTNFFAYQGILAHNSTSPAVSLSFATSTTYVFTLKDIGAIHSVRIVLSQSASTAGTAFNMTYFARTKDV